MLLAYVQRALSKYAPIALVVSIREREKAKATLLTLLQQEEYGEEIKSLKAGKRILKAAKFYSSHPSLISKKIFVPKQNRQKLIGFHRKVFHIEKACI